MPDQRPPVPQEWKRFIDQGAVPHWDEESGQWVIGDDADIEDDGIATPDGDEEGGDE